ncbi:MAG: FAD-binding protein [Eubacterium sp.]|nr:FAD-binding protein [Eubacterium sp.]
MYDIIIIGLGPAGAVFAKCLDRRFSVLAIDKKSESGGFEKPCGGLLAPDAQKALASLGLNLPKDVLVDPQIFSVRTIDLDSGIIKSYQRMYINLDRRKFDLWLMSQLPENISRATGTVTGISKTDSGYRVTYTENGETKTAAAKYIIGADGAKSAVRHFLAPKFKTRTYLSVQQWFNDVNPTPFYSCIFDSKNTDCYSWSVSKDGSFIFGGAYPINGARQAFERQKQTLANLGFRFGKPTKTEACLVLRPRLTGSFCCGKDNVFLIGEAAGFISPSSLEGISSAVISACKLAAVFNSRTPNMQSAYRSAVRGLRFKLAAKNFKNPFMYNKHLRKLVMSSGVKTIKVKGERDF